MITLLDDELKLYWQILVQYICDAASVSIARPDVFSLYAWTFVRMMICFYNYGLRSYQTYIMQPMIIWRDAEILHALQLVQLDGLMPF